MASHAIIIKLKGGRELEWKFGDDARFELLFERMREAVASGDRNIEYDAEFDAERISDRILQVSKGYTTYAMFRSHAYNAMQGQELLNALREDALKANYPELVEKRYNCQLVRFYHLSPDDAVK